jgi:ferredoxin
MVKIDMEKCDQCGTCTSVCPVSALMIIQELIVDQKICTGCGRCIKVCPFSALSSLNAKDLNIR